MLRVTSGRSGETWGPLWGQQRAEWLEGDGFGQPAARAEWVPPHPQIRDSAPG